MKCNPKYSALLSAYIKSPHTVGSKDSRLFPKEHYGHYVERKSRYAIYRKKAGFRDGRVYRTDLEVCLVSSSM